jgi:hypothetical protein
MLPMVAHATHGRACYLWSRMLPAADTAASRLSAAQSVPRGRQPSMSGCTGSNISQYAGQTHTEPNPRVGMFQGDSDVCNSLLSVPAATNQLVYHLPPLPVTAAAHQLVYHLPPLPVTAAAHQLVYHLPPLPVTAATNATSVATGHWISLGEITTTYELLAGNPTTTYELLAGDPTTTYELLGGDPTTTYELLGGDPTTAYELLGGDTTTSHVLGLGIQEKAGMERNGRRWRREGSWRARCNEWGWMGAACGW